MFKQRVGERGRGEIYALCLRSKRANGFLLRGGGTSWWRGSPVMAQRSKKRLERWRVNREFAENRWMTGGELKSWK